MMLSFKPTCAKVLLMIGSIMTSACNNENPSSHNEKKVFIAGKDWTLQKVEQLAFVSEQPRFLRLRFDPDFDLVIDEQFTTNKSADFMSVLATEYGAGRRKHLGPYQLWCGRMPTYNCGVKFVRDGATYLLIFKNEPSDLMGVSRAVSRSEAFIQERS